MILLLKRVVEQLNPALNGEKAPSFGRARASLISALLFEIIADVM